MRFSRMLLLLAPAISLAMNPPEPAPNSLTREEVEAGWILLWDGSSDRSLRLEAFGRSAEHGCRKLCLAA